MNAWVYVSRSVVIRVMYLWFQLICVTNFEGDERRRMKLMIAQIGAKYTGYMTRANSVLIAKQ